MYNSSAHSGENMEQDCITGLYSSLGMPVGAEFSSEDVSLLFCKMFHVPSSTDEAHVAMKKIAGADNSWSCVGENVLHVLLEMEREREKKEKLYWDLQLLNVGNLNPLNIMDSLEIIDPHVLNCLDQSTDHDNSDLGSAQSCTFDTDNTRRERPVGGKKQYWRVRDMRRLKKAGRQCWARLATEGVQRILTSPWQDQIPGVRGQAWGFVSLSDVLLLVGVKYDVVTHLLYTEMLEEHYTLNVWETLLPEQQRKEEEGLEDLAEEALESGDILHLAGLPGAFRIYRAFPECGEQCWSAISLLYELNTSHKQERDTLTVLAERLDRESLRLMCLHIRLATLRAQRAKMSYSALLAARQSWEKWPHVYSPCRADQAILWLRGEKEEQIKYFISTSPQQQAVLQLLVLTHEQERQHLVQLVHGVSLEELQWPDCTVPPNEEDSQKQASLRNVCIKRLRQIHARLQTHSNTQIISEQTYSQLQPQPQMHEHIGTLTEWSQHQLEDCALLFLTHLLELQEVQATTLLPVLMDKSTQHLQALLDECESQLQAKHYTNLHQLLISDATFTSGSILNPNTNMTQSRSKDQITAESSCREPVEAQNISAEPYDTLPVVSVRRASRELKGVQTEDGTNAHDVCTECGAAMEDLPYLEILCVSDTTSNTPEVFGAERGAQGEEEASATKSPQSCEKQGSLIAVAWSKPPEDDTNNEAEAADRKTAQSQEGKGCEQTRDIHSTSEQTQCEETAQSHNEELKPTPFQSGSTGHPESVDQQCSVAQLTLEERPMPTLQMEQPHLLDDSPDIEEHSSDLCSGESSETSNSSREVVEVEMCPIASESQLWELRGPETAHPEDQKYTSQATVDCSLAERKAMRESTLMERERAREPVSAIERERTMRNLVDMQRKVEQRQQRDRERQLLRVQERLSIIQNRKAEEDLLGLKHGDRLRHLTHDLPQEDEKKQKTVVRERLEQLRRERSYVMQSKRDRNTAGFKELLGPVTLHSRDTEDGED